MKTKAVRLYGKNDLRLEEFELPDIKDNEILARVVSDSLCMSSYKAAMLGEEHKRVPKNISIEPIIIGHEFCGEIIEVGYKWREKYRSGDKFVIQPALNYKNTLDAPGYSYKYIGGDATYIIIPNEVMEMDCLIPYHSDVYYHGSLAEPLSCIIGAFNASYHTKQGSYEHIIGTKKGGKMLFVGGAGTMGTVAVDYVLNAYENAPSLLVIYDTNAKNAKNSKKRFENSNKNIRLTYTSDYSVLKEISFEGYDDIFVFSPSEDAVEMADGLLCKDGCLNFFAGPSNIDFSSKINFYNVHYNFTHFVATSGGNSDDMRLAVKLIEERRIDLSYLISYVGGIDSVAEATLNLPGIDGGKKLIYTNISMPLTKISELEKTLKYKNIGKICNNNGGIWNEEAEKYILKTRKQKA